MSVDVQERANRATREFAALAPGLSAYVRVLTGNPRARVAAGPATLTDGEVIYVRPPLALGEPRGEHRRGDCERRDGNLIACPACARVESVYTLVFHELAHIISGSGDNIPEFRLAGARRLMVEEAREFGTQAFADWIAARIDVPIPGEDRTFLNAVAHTIHPALLVLCRALEDVRIEREAFRARPGFQTMSWYATEDVLDRGVELDDGGRDTWGDRTPEEQVVVATVAAGHGHSLEGRLAQEVVDLFALPEVVGILDREMADTADVLINATALLAIFDRCGLFDLPCLEPVQIPSTESPPESETDNEPEPGSGPGFDADHGDAGQPGGADDPADTPAGDAEPVGQPCRDRPDDAGDAGPMDVPRDAGGASDAADVGTVADDGPGPDGEDDADKPASGPAGVEAPLTGAPPEDLPPIEPPPEDMPPIEPPPEDLPLPDFRDSAHADDAAVDAAMGAITGHAAAEELEKASSGGATESAITSAIAAAVALAEVFDEIPARVIGQAIFTTPHARAPGWRDFTSCVRDYLPLERGIVAPFAAHARRVFSDSKTAKTMRNQKRGKLASAKLAKAWDPEQQRLFQRRLRPSGISDFVLIAIDISGSVKPPEMLMMKQAAEAMADLLGGVGVNCALYAHTTMPPTAEERRSFMRTGTLRSFEQALYQVCAPGERWSDRHRPLLYGLQSTAGSLDGHNLEFYRKILVSRPENRRTLIYFTDGRIPATNKIEELPLVKREVETYSRLGLTILAVGVSTDAPKEHGLDTIRIDTSADIGKILHELDVRITAR